MNEAWFWAKVRGAFKDQPRTFLRKLPAEGFAGKGTPDGIYAVPGAQGVLELKYTEWPFRPSTPIDVGDHGVSPEQRLWLEGWVKAGGRGHVLLGVSLAWFLLRIDEVPEDSRVSRDFLKQVARDGRAGTTKTFKDLPALLAAQPHAVVN